MIRGMRVYTAHADAWEAHGRLRERWARAWLAPLLGRAAPPGVVVALAALAGGPVGAAYSLRTDGLAGPCLYLAGVGVLPAARRHGVAAAMSSWLLAQAFAAGAELAHL